MTRLQGGSHIEVFDGKLEADAQDRANNQLELAAIQSDRTPDPCVQYQLFEGHLPVPLSFPMFPVVIP